MVRMDRTYSELIQIDSFVERFRYLSLKGQVGEETFGHDRWINQMFYRSREWKSIRDYVIYRDNGCDLAMPGWDIHEAIYVHHMNPMRPEDIETRDPRNLDPEFLISVTHNTHNAIHYGNEELLPRPFVERRPDDHILWERMS